MGMFKGESYEFFESSKRMFIKSSGVRKYNFGPIEFAYDEYDENPLNENSMFGNKTNKSLKSSANYEILDGEGDESFIQGREDQNMNKKKI